MKPISLTEQWRLLQLVATRRGLRIRKDRRLYRTVWAAMNPRAALELKAPFVKSTLTYRPDTSRRERVENIRHELLEWDKMGQGWHYRAAHLWANKFQRSIEAII